MTTTTTPATTDEHRRPSDGLTGTEAAARDYAAGSYVTSSTAFLHRDDLRAGHPVPGDETAEWWHAYGTEVERLRSHVETVGLIVAELLVTDTRCYEVIRVTPQTITVRPTRDGERTWSENLGGNPWPVVSREQVPDPDAPTQLVRRRKDGTFRVMNGGNPLRPAPRVDGVPVSTTDYRF